LDRLERGASLPHCEAVVGVPARHEFTARHGGATVRCVSYLFASYHLKYYCVFTNGALWKIIQPPRFAHELSAWERGTRAVWTSYDSEERLEVVLHAPDLDRRSLRTSIERRYKPKAFDHTLPGALMVGVVFAPVALARWAGGGAEREELRELARRFDPYRVRLGMTVDEVGALLGTSGVKEALGGGLETRYYGSTKLGTRNPRLWVSVVFQEGRTVRVFSGDFFDYQRLEGRLKESEAKP
jgi:hypothetical protein